MFCPSCGAQNDESYRFCKSCGNDLGATLPLSAATPAVHELSEIDLVKQELAEEYEILEELGRGGMAIVFRCREKQLDREVAIKVLPFSLAFDKEFVQRFQREARTAAKLEHPNIIPIYRVGKAGRVIYFVMKFLRGKPLSAVLADRGALPPAEIRHILIQVARALAYAHRSGIVHRDIKPDNIMFDEHGQAVVTDFGIAKAASGGRLTGTGMAIGTPHYMSPEQARAQSLDGRSDLYSLGVVAYQCLAGQVPFDGEDSFSIGYKHIMEALPTPALDTAEQQDLFLIVSKMLAKQPADRFQNADELVAVLESGGGAESVKLSTAQTRSIPSVSVPRASTSPTTPIPRASTAAVPREHSAGTALLLWGLIVAGVVGGGYYAWRKGYILASPQPTRPDTALAAHETTAAVGSGDSSRAGKGDSGAAASATTGTIVLNGLPTGARVTLDGQPVKGSEIEVPIGTHALIVRAAGFRPFDRQVTVLGGTTSSVSVDLAAAPDPCSEPGPEYNRDNVCFDTKPSPLVATFVPVPPDAQVVRPAIFWIKVSQEGKVLEIRLVTTSGAMAFDQQAMDLAKAIGWNPAQKNGEPVDAWIQSQFRPQPH
ncbi:MAG TPA: protein kinase [Gemmatimonadales bacterium]|nr:protein kinase [Gemmatimonadales bacterium]